MWTVYTLVYPQVPFGLLSLTETKAIVYCETFYDLVIISVILNGKLMKTVLFKPSKHYKRWKIYATKSFQVIIREQTV